MNNLIFAVVLSMGMFALTGSASAGGKPDGATCHVHKSCKSKLCLRADPLDKFGACCTQQDCPSLNAQCGEIDNGCGTPIQCGDCGPGNDCVANQCVQSTTTTTIPVPASCAGRCGDSSGAGGCYCDALGCPSANNDGCADLQTECPGICATTTTTTTTSTTTTTTTSTTSTTIPGGTTTTTTSTTTSTLPLFEGSCEGICGSGNAAPGSNPECFCDSLSCSIGDGCPNRDTFCPGICDPPTTTTTTTSTTSTTIP